MKIGMAKKNPDPTQPERPMLRGPRGNAHELIRRQVEAGEQILASATSPASVTELAKRQRNWRDYTRDLLRSLFTTDDIAREFDRYPSNAWDPNSQRYLRNLRSEHDKNLDNLKSIFLRVELFDEASTNAPGQKDGGEPPYYGAQVCQSGHVVNTSVELCPEALEGYCSKCGKKTITACPTCQTPIRGTARFSYGTGNEYTCPAYCPKCGSAYPWTSLALLAAKELAQLELSQVESNELADLIENLVTDTPQTTVAASRFRGIMSKATPAVAEGFKAILVNVATEAAKRMMFP